MNSVDLFERVHRGELTSAQAAELMMKQRESSMRPTKPAWLPRPFYLVALFVLTLVLPGLVGRGS